MREILEKHERENPLPCISIGNELRTAYINKSASILLNLQKGDKIILSKKDGNISIAIDSRLEPSKHSYALTKSDIANVYRVCSNHIKSFEKGHYLVPEKPTEFDGKYDWYDLEKISDNVE